MISAVWSSQDMFLSIAGCLRFCIWALVSCSLYATFGRTVFIFLFDLKSTLLAQLSQMGLHRQGLYCVAAGINRHDVIPSVFTFSQISAVIAHGAQQPLITNEKFYRIWWCFTCFDSIRMRESLSPRHSGWMKTASALFFPAFLFCFLVLPTPCGLITRSVHSVLCMAGLCLPLTHSLSLPERLGIRTPPDWGSF